EAVEAPVFVAQRRNDYVRPETRAVFAQPPPFFLVSALGCGPFQLIRRPIAGNRVWWIKNGKVLADDFPRRIALDALGADVPGLDDAVLVEHEDGIVAHRFHKQAKGVAVMPVFQAFLGRHRTPGRGRHWQCTSPLITTKYVLSCTKCAI